MEKIPNSINIVDVLKQLVTRYQDHCHVLFAGQSLNIPELAYCVDFPRVEIIVSGQLSMQWQSVDGQLISHCLKNNDILFIAPNRWNIPNSNGSTAVTLSILFGKQRLGISLLRWNAGNMSTLVQENIPRRGPRVGAFILQALNELTTETYNQQTANMLIQSLLSHVIDLFCQPVTTESRSRTLFRAIRDYIELHYQQPISRESVAAQFCISPNYLSHLFQKENDSGFNEYLIHNRLEHAKELLKQCDVKVKDIAHQSGFSDSNYFCRLFRKNTARTPSEYRRHYLSQPQHNETE